MERNDDFNSQNSGQGGVTGGSSSGIGSTGAGSVGGSGYGAGGLGGTSGAQQNVGGTSGGYGGGFNEQGGASGAGLSGENMGDEARTRFQQGKEAVTDRLGTIKEKASNLNATLADKLEAGADKLRQRGQSGQTGQLAGATGAGSVGVGSEDRMAQVGSRVATGLEGTADWLRNGDLQQTIESQVRTNPGRTLLIALGLGYVLGKAFRR